MINHPFPTTNKILNKNNKSKKEEYDSDNSCKMSRLARRAMCTSDDVAAANTAIGWPTGVPQSRASYSYLQFGNTPLYQPPSADIKSYHHLAILFFLSEALTVLHGIAWYCT